MDGISYLHPDEPRIPKRVGATLDYGFSWVEWLADIGDSIASATVEGAGGLTVTAVTHADGIVSCMASGGSVGVQASLKCTVVTTGPPVRTDTRTLYVDVVA